MHLYFSVVHQAIFSRSSQFQRARTCPVMCKDETCVAGFEVVEIRRFGDLRVSSRSDLKPRSPIFIPARRVTLRSGRGPLACAHFQDVLTTCTPSPPSPPKSTATLNHCHDTAAAIYTPCRHQGCISDFASRVTGPGPSLWTQSLERARHRRPRHPPPCATIPPTANLPRLSKIIKTPRPSYRQLPGGTHTP